MVMGDSAERKYVYVLFILSIITQCLAITVFIILTALDYIGFDGGNPISATCTDTYFITKYGQVTLMVEIAYIMSILALSSFTVVLAIIIRSTVQTYHSQELNIFISNCIKICLFIFTGVAIMAAIPVFGYYLAISAQIYKCTAAYNSTNIIVILVMAAILLALLLAVFILLFVLFFNSSQEKYREVQNNTTEPHGVEEPKYLNKKFLEKEEPFRKQPQVYEKRTPQELSRSSPPKKIINKNQELQHTKQQLFNSPSRQPTFNVYSKQIEPQRVIKGTPQRKYETPKEPAPLLQPKSYKKQYNPSENSRLQPPSKEGELVFYKGRNKGMVQDEDFTKQQNRFLSKYADRPILPSSGVQEVIRQKRTNDYFYQEDLPRRAGQTSSPTRQNREGNLLGKIRGKYAH